MEKVPQKLNNMMKLENQNILLFLDNAPVHPESLVGKYSHIRVVFLPKNTTSRLQPLDAGIIQSFKVKYRKSYYVMWLQGYQTNVMDVVKEVDILQAITWAAAAWKEVSEMAIKNCFGKCGVV